MPQFQYKNPIVNSQVTGADSVETRQQYVGTNFSVYNIGGYMEVWNLEDLQFSWSGTGFIEFSANTIPIKFNKSGNILGDKVFLYNDGISSGRRRLGMLVYVHETNTTYQFQIDENNSADSYENMWSAATAIPDLVVPSSEEIAVSNKVGVTFHQAGQNLIDAWTGSTIEGYNGVSRDDAKWRIFWGTDWQVTGGTINYNSTGDLSLSSNSGNTVTLSGLTTITGGTYLSGTSTLELYNNLGNTISVTGFTGGGGTSGSSGSSGTSGSSGSSGTSGSSGSSGTSGSSGSSGTSGSSGSSGTSGSSGSSGTSGSSGSSGTSGTLALTGNTIDGVITYNGSGGSVESNLTFNGDTDTLVISGDSYTYGNQYTQSADLTTTTNGDHDLLTISLTNISGSSFNFNYFVEEQTTGGFRTGIIMAAVNRAGDTTVYTDNSTVDGTSSTDNIVFSTVISGSNLILRATTTNSTTWYVKVGVEIII